MAAADQVPDGTVAQDLGFNQEIQGHGDVIRGEADKEDHGAAQHHPQRSPLLPLVGNCPHCFLPQAPRGQAAAGYHQDQGDDEPQQFCCDQEGPHRWGADVLCGELCETHSGGSVGGVRALLAGPQQREGEAHRADQHPAHYAHEQVSFTPGQLEPQGAHDELAATHANAHQEVDGGVHVDVFQIEADLTQRLPKEPVFVEVIVDAHRQGEHLRGGGTQGFRGHRQTGYQWVPWHTLPFLNPMGPQAFAFLLFIS